MSASLQTASSARSRCRGCGQTIGKGEMRFGVPKPFGEGELTLWSHPLGAAFKRPEALLAAPAGTDPEPLERAAKRCAAHRRLPLIDGAERAASGSAGSRSCTQPIEHGAWRIRLAFFEEGRFAQGGFVHLHCRAAHFECEDVLEQMMHFSTGLDEGGRADLRTAGAGTAP